MKIPERIHWLPRLLGRNYVVAYPFVVLYASQPRLLTRVNALWAWWNFKTRGFFKTLVTEYSPIREDELAQIESMAVMFPQLQEAVRVR